MGTDKWVKCNDYPVIDTAFTVPNLTENAEFDFRVCAVNAAGPSDYGTTSSPIKVKEKLGK